MKVAIYCRVSTDKQELEKQLIQLRRYADKSNWEIYHEKTKYGKVHHVSPVMVTQIKKKCLENGDAT
jgi:DNA invertase Pin-like site-specific DNA recombinase